MPVCGFDNVYETGYCTIAVDLDRHLRQSREQGDPRMNGSTCPTRKSSFMMPVKIHDHSKYVMYEVERYTFSILWYGKYWSALVVMRRVGHLIRLL